ncbi:TM2 domain-containing protein [bacterium]|nr:TM2 domain-containing protein [bacterium]
MSMDYEIQQAPKSSRSYIVTLLLAMFLSGFGIHRFYTGYILIGIIQLLTAGGFGIWALIDLIALVMNSYRDAEGNELEGHNAGCAMIVGIVLIISFVMGGISTMLSFFSH